MVYGWGKTWAMVALGSLIKGGPTFGEMEIIEPRWQTVEKRIRRLREEGMRERQCTLRPESPRADYVLGRSQRTDTHQCIKERSGRRAPESRTSSLVLVPIGQG